MSNVKYVSSHSHRNDPSQVQSEGREEGYTFLTFPFVSSHGSDSNDLWIEQVVFLEEFEGRLHETCDELNISEEAVFLAAWSILLHRYGNAEPFEVRQLTETDKGLQMHTMKVEVSSDIPVQDWLKNVEEKLVQVPLDIYPIASTQLLFSRAELFNLGTFRKWNVQVALCWKRTAKSVVLSLVGDGRSFTRPTVKRMAEQLRVVLEASVQTRNAIGDVPILPKEELFQILEWKGKRTSYPQLSIQEVFAEQVRQHPYDIAVMIDHENQLTYQELEERSNQVAHYLLKLGVQAEDRVGLCMSKSIGMVVAMLGILKAGCAYVPLDVSDARLNSRHSELRM